jgi:uncharacterized protein
VIDTEPFQRLRDVQQLALTHLVYPGARHSRYEHCMGACHVSGDLANALGIGVDRVRLAALVHDIGHGPFSHVSEAVFEAFTGREHIHERISSAIIEQHPDVNAAIGDDAPWVADLLRGTGHAKVRSVERDIVAGPADIDKLDYLLRDSHFCGVEYGRFDIDKLVESARVAPLRFGTATGLGFHRNGIFALEGMLLARYHMHRQVYGHRTRIATDLMLIRAMMLGVEEGVLPRNVFCPPEEMDSEFVGQYLMWDDKTVTRTLHEADGATSSDIMRALGRRRLLKRVFRFSGEDLQTRFGKDGAGYILIPEGDVLRLQQPAAESMIAEAAEVAPHWVHLYWEHLQNPITKSSSFRVQDKDVLIVPSDGSDPVPFHEASEVFSDTEKPARRSICLYIRPPGDQPFDAPILQRIEAACYEALNMIGAASAAP